MKLPRFVSPDGSLLQQPAKLGLLMGNRGILGERHFAMPQPAAGKPWLTCLIKKNGRPIEKTPVKYNKLFMLDEVTAFAAGHRPCFSCQRPRYHQFMQFWEMATGRSAEEVDTILGRERCDDKGHKMAFTSLLGELPSGVFVRIPGSERPFLFLWGKLFPWTPDGYERPLQLALHTEVQVLTPKSVVQMFKEGFPLPINREETVHPSVLAHL